MFDRDRFVSAQAPVYTAVVDELQAARKRSHWCWRRTTPPSIRYSGIPII